MEVLMGANWTYRQLHFVKETLSAYYFPFSAIAWLLKIKFTVEAKKMNPI